MKLLIIGGTRFLGRHLVNAALATGHQVTLFNRGNYSPKFSQTVEEIHGDRNQDLDRLQGRNWDAVIDTCGILPRQVKASAEFFAGSVKTYCFVSSQSAYADVSNPGVLENSPLKDLTDEELEEAYKIDGSTPSASNYGRLYGGLKALSERAAQEAIPNRTLMIRPGLIVGPFDYTDRFTYWPVRVARGGDVLTPGRPDRHLQYIDARDLAEWMIKIIEAGATGVFNASGQSGSLTMRRLLEACKNVSKSNASFTWVSEEFLFRENVVPWSEMPLWLPEEAAPYLKGFMFINSEKAVGSGLKYRLVTETIHDTLDWFQKERESTQMQAGISPQREEMLLRKWHQMN